MKIALFILIRIIASI